eukprot:132917-Chlamydomonas_euryale.AAC.1
MRCPRVSMCAVLCGRTGGRQGGLISRSFLGRQECPVGPSPAIKPGGSMPHGRAAAGAAIKQHAGVYARGKRKRRQPCHTAPRGTLVDPKRSEKAFPFSCGIHTCILFVRRARAAWPRRAVWQGCLHFRFPHVPSHAPPPFPPA